MVPSKKEDDIDSLLSSDPTSDTSTSARVLEANAGMMFPPQPGGIPGATQSLGQQPSSDEAWKQSLESLRQSIIAENQQLGWNPDQQPQQPQPPGASPILPQQPPMGAQPQNPPGQPAFPIPFSQPQQQPQPVAQPAQAGGPEMPPPPGDPFATRRETHAMMAPPQPAARREGAATLSDVMEELRIIRERQELIIEKLNVIEERVRRAY